MWKLLKIGIAGGGDNNAANNVGIYIMGKFVEWSTGKKTASKAYDIYNGEMPTKYVRKFHFDYMKDGAKTPNLSR